MKARSGRALGSWACVACIASAGLAAQCPEEIPTELRSIDDTFGRLESQWIDSQVRWSWSRPVAIGDIVIFATGDQRLIARDRASGVRRWATRVTSVNRDAFIQGLNLVSRSGVVVAAISRNVVGVEVSTGRELWSYGAPTDSLVDPPGVPATVARVALDVDDSTVYVPAWGASISAVDLRTGQPRWVWRQPTGTEYRAGGKGVRVSGDTVFATVWHDLNGQHTSTEGWLVEIDRRDGAELRRAVIPAYTFGAFLNGAPAVWNNLVIVTGAGGRVWAFDRPTMQLAWQYQPAEGTGTTEAAPELYDDVIYTDGGDNHVVALHASDGSLVWRTNALALASASLLVTERRIYVPQDWFLGVLDRLSGRWVARTEQPGATYASGSFFATPATSSGAQVFITVGNGAWSFIEP